MSIESIKQRLKPWMLPIAMVIGLIFHEPINALQFLVPYLIFTMLLITFCRVRPADLCFDKMVWRLMAVQMFGSVGLFFCLQPFNLPFAQAMMICVLCPTACAAPVVTGMLGGSIGRVASYSIVSNLLAAVLAPFMFVIAGDAEIDFWQEFGRIVSHVAPMIVLPLALAWFMYYFAPRAHKVVVGAQKLTYYMWAFSLTLVVGKSVSFIISEPASAIGLMVGMAVGAFFLCLSQFWIGRRVGASVGDKVSAAQSLGQKNTILAIWMAVNYMDPISSVGPAAYVAWQNVVNSMQLFFKMRRDSKAA